MREVQHKPRLWQNGSNARRRCCSSEPAVHVSVLVFCGHLIFATLAAISCSVVTYIDMVDASKRVCLFRAYRHLMACNDHHVGNAIHTAHGWFYHCSCLLLKLL